MALRFQTPPDKAVRAMTAALEALRTTPVAGFRMETAPALRYPHIVYHLGLDDLASGKGLEAATPVSWGHVAGAMLVEARYDTQELSQINQGPFAAGIANSVARIEGSQHVAGADFELAVLKIPGIYLLALWLRGNNDTLVPVPPAPREFEPERFYNAPEFLAIARPLAQRRLETDNSPRRI